MLGGVVVLAALRHDLRAGAPRSTEPGRAAGSARSAGGVPAPVRRARRTVAARRRAAEARARAVEEEQKRPLAFHPRAEARRVLYAARQAQARVEAARQREAEAQAARTWAGYGYSYGGASTPPAPRRRPSPRRTAKTPSQRPARVPTSRGTIYASASARGG
jgi:hypothetical protein